MAANDLTLGTGIKEYTLIESYQNASKKVYVSIGSMSNAKIGNAVESNFNGDNGMITLTTGSTGILYNVSPPSGGSVTIKYIFLGSSASNYQDIARIDLEASANEQITFDEDSVYVIASIKIDLQEGN